MAFHSVLIAALLTGLCSGAFAAPARPRIFVTGKDLPRLRAMASDARQSVLGYAPKEAWQALVARADHFAAAPPYHYAVNMPGPEGGPSKRWEYTLSKEPPPRHDDYKHYPPWTAMFQERGDSITTRLKHLLLAHIVTGDEKYFVRAKGIVFNLCAWPGIWTDPSYSSGKRACLDTGHAATWVGIFYDWCYEQLTQDERAAVRTALVNKALVPIDGIIAKLSPYHNYTAIVATGLCVGAISLLGEDDRALTWVEHATAAARANFDAQGKDGGAMEGPMYGTYAADGLADMLWALSTAGIPNELVAHPYIKTLPRYCVSLLSPNSRQQPCFGDGGPIAGFTNMLLVLALRGDTDAAWYCQQVAALQPNTPRRFLLLDPERIRPQVPKFNPSMCFLDVGYAILRDGYKPGPPFLAFKAGPPDKKIGHNHYDHNSFVINYASAWLAWDPGYRNYTYPPERRYTVSAFGHNTIVMDLDDAYLRETKLALPGHDQVHLNRGRIAEFFASTSFDYVLGEAAETYNTDKAHVLDRFDRQVIFAKPHVFFIRDTLEAPDPHTYSFMLHARASDDLVVEGSHATVSAPDCYLQTYVFSPAGIRMATADYPGAEKRGPYLAATTAKVKQTTITCVLVPRRHRLRIANGGFEKGMEGWMPRGLTDWLKNHVIDTEVRHSGKASARLDGPGGYYYGRKFSLEPGTKINARWWAKCTAARGASSLFYYWKDGKSFARTQGPVANVNEWRQYEFTDVVPAGTEQACLAIQFFGQGQCWYDDVELTADCHVPESRPAEVTQLSPTGTGAVAVVDGLTYVMVCGQAGQMHSTAAAGRTISTDAELAVVALTDDASRAFILKGTRLDVDGQPVAQVQGNWLAKRE